MKESELIKLGFKKEYSSDLVDKKPMFYYYVIDIEDFALISNSNTEAIADGWHVEFFDSQSIRFTNAKDLKSQIELLKRNIVVKNVQTY